MSRLETGQRGRKGQIQDEVRADGTGEGKSLVEKQKQIEEAVNSGRSAQLLEDRTIGVQRKIDAEHPKGSEVTRPALTSVMSK